jgi:phage tail-like protein
VPLLMDANGTRFHLLLGQDDWARCRVVPSGESVGDAFVAQTSGKEPAVSWSARGELTLGTRISIFPTAPANQPPDPAQRRGAAVDPILGEVFWIGNDEQAIFVAAPGADPLLYWSAKAPPRDAVRIDKGTFQPTDDAPKPLTLRGLAVIGEGYLVAGVLEPRGLLVFDLRTGGTPRQLLWPDDVPFEPFDLAAAPDGGVVILDRKNARVWRLDDALQVVAPWLDLAAPQPLFRPMDGGAVDPACLTVPVTAEHGFATTPGAIAVEALNDGSVVVLINPASLPETFSTIRRYRDGKPAGEFTTQLAAALIDPESRPQFSLLAHDFVHVTRGAEELLMVVGAAGDQAINFRLTFENDTMKVEPLPDFAALRLFGGKGFAAAGDKVYYDLGDRWLPAVAQHRGRYQRSATIRILRAGGKALDSRQLDCVWHRLFLDVCIPPECDVVVATRCANEEALLAGAPQVIEPTLIRRAGGSELPWSPSCEAGIATWELLFQRAKGRFLEIELTLVGTGRSTPRIRALRAYYPRFSYLSNYLPAVYRENSESASFLDRFLALFEGFFTTIEDKIAAAQMLLDVRGVPADALEWLGGWFSIAFDDAWNERKRRLFLQHAGEFFEWRGTAAGLHAALRLALDDCPDESIFDFAGESPPSGIRIVESFRRRSATLVPSIAASSLNPTDAAAVADAAAAEMRASGASEDHTRATWTAHLGRTYGSVTALNRALGTAFERLDAVPLLTAFTADWTLFQEAVFPVQQHAHDFAVFLPLPPGSGEGPRRVAVATRVLQLEKPAHTTFSVDTYWTWFRLGEARLGENTVVDLGSRSPSLVSPYAINQTRIGASFLVPDSARIGPGRMILGRSCRRIQPTAGEPQ